MSCTICRVRKEKRFCPALHDRICPQCCGEQREVTLDCPAACPYLQQARLHEKPSSHAEASADDLFPGITLTEAFLQEREPLIAGVLQTLGKMARQDRALHDRDVLGALTNMARSYQRLVNSGLVYDEQLPSLPPQAILEALRRLLHEFRDVEQKHLGYSTLKDGDILRTLVFCIRLGQAHTSGRPRSRAFLDSLNSSFPDTPLNTAETPAGSIILP